MPRPEPVGKTTFEEYLELEARSQVRHEFVDGMIFAMAGGTDRHDVIVGNPPRLPPSAAEYGEPRSEGKERNNEQDTSDEITSRTNIVSQLVDQRPEHKAEKRLGDWRRFCRQGLAEGLLRIVTDPLPPFRNHR
jgi:hypothetical protein